MAAGGLEPRRNVSYVCSTRGHWRPARWARRRTRRQARAWHGHDDGARHEPCSPLRRLPPQVAGIAAAAIKQVNTPAFQQMIAGALGAAAQASTQRPPPRCEAPVRPPPTPPDASDPARSAGATGSPRAADPAGAAGGLSHRVRDAGGPPLARSGGGDRAGRSTGSAGDRAAPPRTRPRRSKPPPRGSNAGWSGKTGPPRSAGRLSFAPTLGRHSSRRARV